MTTPPVSILLPVRNEAKNIHEIISSILNQDYPGEMEILVVDGMSTDDTRVIIAGICSQHAGINLRILDNPGKIVPTGMNIALREAQGEIIIRVDGHCIIAPDYVRRCVAHLLTDGVDGVGGPMQSIGETRLAETIALGMSSQFGVGNSAFRTTSGVSRLVDSVPFPAYTRAMIERAGLYDEELVRNQDDEYNYRIRELGGKILLADDVRSKYYSRGSLGKLWRQYYQYGYWKVRVLQKHPRQMSLRQFVPALFVLGLVGSLLLLTVPGLGSVGWMLPLLYLTANLAASILVAGKAGWRHMALLPVVYAILHMGYGSGFLVGLVAFAQRWGDKIGQQRLFGDAG